MKKTVLIADEDASVRKALARVLEEEGYQIIMVADARETLERFESGAVDLLLMDISLPMKSGWAAFERITGRAQALPIIIVAAKANPYDMGIAASIGTLMEKPLDVSQLLQKIQELLAESQEDRLRRLSAGHDPHYLSSLSAESR